MRNLFALLILNSTLLCSQLVVGQELCSAGKFYNEAAQKCESCQPGTFANGKIPLSSCEPCPPGTTTPYQNTEKCIAGGYKLKATRCMPCPAGTFSKAGQDECTPCAPGYMTHLAHSSSCSVCPRGSYEVNRTTCSTCPAGSTSLEGAKGFSECFPCPTGYVCDEMTGKSFKCPGGTYELNRAACQKCLPGTFSPGGASGSCTPCEAGKVSFYSGATTCKSCEPGKFAKNPTSCEKCPAGTFGKDGTCSKCPSGRISFGGAKDCMTCPRGTFEVDSTQCKDCPMGTISNVGSTSCESCPSGTLYVNATFCKDVTDVKKDVGQDVPALGKEEEAPKNMKPEEEVPKKEGNNVMKYVLGIGLVAVLFFVAVYKCNQKPHQFSKDETEVERQNEMKTFLIHHGKD